jgi:DNA recombination protein RmuC
MELVLVLVVGILVGFALGWVISRANHTGPDATVLEARHELALAQVRQSETSARAEVEAQLAAARASVDGLNRELIGMREQLKRVLDQHAQEAKAREAAGAAESKVLQQMAPITKTLDDMHRKVADLEKQRATQHGEIAEQIKVTRETAEQSRAAASQLAAALSNNATRGAYGETQLRSVVESAGMVRHVDFLTQETVQTESGGRRPDMVINLPGGKQMAVDAKMPLADYLREGGVDVDDARRKQLLGQHTKAVKTHIDALAAKSYWSGLSASPEFTIAFIGNDAALNAALDVDPSLMEYAFGKGIVLATPANLWSLLKTVAFTWQQDALTEDAKALFDLGKQLYERISTMAGHVTKLGRSIETSVNDYNKFVSSLETRVLVTARKLDAVDGSKLIPAPREIDEQPRRIVADEFTAALGEVERPELEFFEAEVLDDEAERSA